MKKLTKAVARKVLEVVDAGLCSGVGEPIPGKMCVEAAVCFALGQPHGDEPACVGAAVRSFKIRLNDAPWSSNTARAKGMRRVALAQLGSDQIDQQEFAKEVALQTIRQILPLTLRALIPLIISHKDALESAALACESAVDLRAAWSAASAARSAAWSAAESAESAESAASAARSAAWSAESAAWSAWSAAERGGERGERGVERGEERGEEKQSPFYCR